MVINIHQHVAPPEQSKIMKAAKRGSAAKGYTSLASAEKKELDKLRKRQRITDVCCWSLAVTVLLGLVGGATTIMTYAKLAYRCSHPPYTMLDEKEFDQSGTS